MPTVNEEESLQTFLKVVFYAASRLAIKSTCGHTHASEWNDILIYNIVAGKKKG